MFISSEYQLIFSHIFLLSLTVARQIENDLQGTCVLQAIDLIAGQFNNLTIPSSNCSEAELQYNDGKSLSIPINSTCSDYAPTAQLVLGLDNMTSPGAANLTIFCEKAAPLCLALVIVTSTDNGKSMSNSMQEICQSLSNMSLSSLTNGASKPISSFQTSLGTNHSQLSQTSNSSNSNLDPNNVKKTMPASDTQSQGMPKNSEQSQTSKSDSIKPPGLTTSQKDSNAVQSESHSTVKSLARFGSNNSCSISYVTVTQTVSEGLSGYCSLVTTTK